MLIFNH